MTGNINDTVIKAWRRVGEAVADMMSALGDVVRSLTDAFVTFLDSAPLREALAVEAAPPRVRHLARHGKKHRVRKKNKNRAIREYRKRGPKA